MKRSQSAGTVPRDSTASKHSCRNRGRTQAMRGDEPALEPPWAGCQSLGAHPQPNSSPGCGVRLGAANSICGIRRPWRHNASTQPLSLTSHSGVESSSQSPDVHKRAFCKQRKGSYCEDRAEYHFSPQGAPWPRLYSA